jgi:hypothetical protein
MLAAMPSVWAEFLRSCTVDAISTRTGDLKDFSLPFAQGFSVEREVVARVLGKLRKGVPAVAIVGPPLSGKSVVLKQCCEKLATGNLVPLYVDASSARQGPLQLLASVFSKNLFTATSLDHVRQWLSTSLRAMHEEAHLVLFFDDIVPDLNDTWLGDLDELLALGSASPISIVTALDPTLGRHCRCDQAVRRRQSSGCVPTSSISSSFLIRSSRWRWSDYSTQHAASLTSEGSTMSSTASHGSFE